MAYGQIDKEYIRHEYPKTVHFSLTGRCQCNCRHCGVKHLNTKIKDELSLSQIREIFKDLKLSGFECVYLFGGEPTLRKDIFDIIKLGKSFGFSMFLDTNALLLSHDYIKKLKDSGIDRILISLDDYIEKNHDANRRHLGTFRAAVKALNYCRELGIEAHTSFAGADPQYFIGGNINKYIQFCLDNGAKKIRILFPCFVGNSSGKVNTPHTENDEKRLITYIDKKFYDAAYVDSECNMVKGIVKREIYCGAKWGTYLYIHTNGWITPCPYLPLVFGDITKESVAEITSRIRDYPYMKHTSSYCPTRDKDFLQNCLGGIDKESPFRIVKSLNSVDFGGKCNNSCRGCVLASKEKTKEEILGEISKIDKGYGSIYLYGGEIFTRKDIFEILDSIPKDFRINICSNARVFSYAGLVSKLKKYNINAVKVPFFPFDIDEFDSFTNVKGGFIQTVDGIKNLCRNGVPVSVYIPEDEVDDDGHGFLISLGVSSISSYEKSDSDCLPDSALCFGKKIKKSKLIWIKEHEKKENIVEAVKDEAPKAKIAIKSGLQKDEEGFYYNSNLKKEPKKYLLINPSVVDTEDLRIFNMANLPTGILRIANLLVSEGNKINYFDFEPYSMDCKKEKIDLNSKRDLFIYGKSFDDFRDYIKNISKIDEILISTTMTYHYPHLNRLIEIIKETQGDIKITVGGLYATLCPEEIKKLGVNVHVGAYSNADFYRPLVEITSQKNVGVLRIVKGCPNNCSYCAVSKLEGTEITHCSVVNVIKHFQEYYSLGIRNFMFLDSNLLFVRKQLFAFMDYLIDNGYSKAISLDFSYGIDFQLIDDELIEKLKQIKIVGTFMVPLESSEYDLYKKRFGKPKNHLESIERAVKKLKSAGLERLAFYFLVGLPNQTLDQVLKTLIFGMKLRIFPCVMLFTPIPRTKEYEDNIGMFKGKEPWQLNPNLFPCESKELTGEDMLNILHIFHTSEIHQDNEGHIIKTDRSGREIKLSADSRVIKRFKVLLKNEGGLPKAKAQSEQGRGIDVVEYDTSKVYDGGKELDGWEADLVSRRMFDYNRELVPNRHIAELESSTDDIKSAIKKTGLSIGYPAWNMLYYSLICSLPSKEEEVVVVETGTNLGFSTIMLAQALKDLKLKGFVYTADIDGVVMESAKQNVEKAGLSDYVKFKVQDSLEFLSQLAEEKEQVHFAFLDSNHQCEHVKKEFSIIHPKILKCKGMVYFDNTTHQEIARALDFIKKTYGGNIIEFKNCSWGPPGNAVWQPD